VIGSVGARGGRRADGSPVPIGNRGGSRRTFQDLSQAYRDLSEYVLADFPSRERLGPIPWRWPPLRRHRWPRPCLPPTDCFRVVTDKPATRR